jgi:hypothetical protein
MRKQIVALTVALGATWWVAACGNGQVEGREAENSAPGEEMMEGASPASSFVEREFWLALAEEPGWHLNVAHDLFLAGKTGEASQELAKVAAILNFESRHSHSEREEGLLLASVQELREVARELRFQEVPYEGLPSIEELDRVSALTFRSIAAHQVTLARDALEAGDARMAGRYVLETSKAIENGFARGGIEMGNVLTEQLRKARELAARMEMDGNGTLAEGRVTLGALDEAVRKLGEVLTSGRK